MIPPLTTPTPPGLPGMSPEDKVLMGKAQELEAGFLSEMLSFTGLDEGGGSFGGGAGEDQFASLLRDEQAREMVKGGGIGLAQTIFESLTRMRDAKP